MKAFKMPSLGADMEDGTLVEWFKTPGDNISRGDIVAVVETVKGAIEIECFDEGKLERIVAEPGMTVRVGEVLAYLAVEALEAVHAEAAPAGEPEPELTRHRPSRQPAAVRRISPVARRRANELGLDIADVRPGPEGIIGLAEVDAAAARAAPEYRSQPAKQGLDRAAMRDAIGRAMARSKREIPHYYVSSTLDMERFQTWFAQTNAARSVAERLLYAAPLLKAVASALKAVPELNGNFVDGAYHPSEKVHVGVATALRGGGLIAPAIHDTDSLELDQTMTRLRDIVARVRSGRIRGSEMSDPTVTLSLLGEDSADSLQPVIYPPQVAIIGCGALRERPWVVDDRVVVRRVMAVTVAGDHRVSDGRSAARFLNRLDAILQEPELL